MFSVIQNSYIDKKSTYVVKQTNLQSKKQANEWITQHITNDINEHWIICSDDLNKLSSHSIFYENF